MAKFMVTLSAEAWVGASIEVEASDEAQAKAIAIAKAQEGDVVWKYDGVQEATEEATAITEVD